MNDFARDNQTRKTSLVVRASLDDSTPSCLIGNERCRRISRQRCENAAVARTSLQALTVGVAQAYGPVRPTVFPGASANPVAWDDAAQFPIEVRFQMLHPVSDSDVEPMRTAMQRVFEQGLPHW